MLHKREERLLPPPKVLQGLCLRLISARHFSDIVNFYFDVMKDFEMVSFVMSTKLKLCSFLNLNKDSQQPQFQKTGMHS